MASLLAYRRVKHGEPIKLKVLAEDLPRRPWLDRLSSAQFIALVAVGCLATSGVVYSVTDPRIDRQIDEFSRSTKKEVAEWIEGLQPRSETVEIVRARKKSETARFTLTKANGCHPSYRGCLPVGVDVDCAGGMGDGPVFTGRVQVIGPDFYNLDGDGDGVGCE